MCCDQATRPHTIQGREVETRRQTARQYVGTQEAKLQVKKIWIGAPEDMKGVRGHTGLGDSITDDDLRAYFSAFGPVTHINQLMWIDTKKKRGYGYIEFEDSDAVDKVVISRIHVIQGVRLEVKKAVQRLQGGGDKSGGNFEAAFGGMMGFGGGGGGDASWMGGGGRKRGLDAMAAPRKKQKLEPRDPESEIMRRMFVGNLNPVTTDDELREYFESYGVGVENVKIKKHLDSGKSRGFGFVLFSRSDDVDTILHNRPHTCQERARPPALNSWLIR